MIKALTPMVCAVLVAVIVMFAIANDVNGAILASGLAIIGGLGGYGVKVLNDHYVAKKQEEEK